MMVRKRVFFITGLISLIGATGLTQLPIAVGVSSAYRLTLTVPRTVNSVNAQTWCQAADAKGTATPFGFNRVRFYRDKTDIKEQEYLIGCVTNNFGHTIESLSASYTVRYPPNISKVAGGFSYFNIPTLKPGQTVFFKSNFQIDSEAIGVNVELQLPKQQGQTLITEPIETLVIRRR